ncbi:hypothetical protein U9M48_016306 [Paspalum notatum var. saurae]|uniref:Uncharacterized protein n=1 Tax=Paspalum notatum var. saurae TaxID=547442 RepID=A0AAQ3T6S4_PASNO
MPPLAAAEAFLVLEFIAGNRRIPNTVFAALLTSLPSYSVSPLTSPRLRKALVLRALHAALQNEDTSCSSTLLLGKVRRILDDPDAAACFPHHLSFADNEENDGARAAAAVADLKCIIDHEWSNLPPSTLELAAERIAGDGSLQTWAAADHTKRAKLRLLVGESREREILAKLMQDASGSHPPIPPEVADNPSDANEDDGAQRDEEADPSKENDGVDRAQEGMVRHQDASVKGADGVQLPEKSFPVSNKCRPTERNPNASRNMYERDGLGESDGDRPVGKRELPPFQRKPNPSAYAHKMRKKWSEIEEKTLLEGVKKHGKGNWKDIKLAYPDVFEGRSTVDLKDKFRNMERHLASA